MNVNDDMYREQLLDIYKNPMNRGIMKDPSVEVFKKNPFCGDNLSLQLKINNGIVEQAKFDGQSCFVTIASSALVTEDITGKPLDYAKNLTEQDVLNLIGVELTTSRMKCATLILTALSAAISQYEK